MKTEKTEDTVICMKSAREEYGDILDHEHYVDPNHPQMSRLNRAAQFSSFSALSGYEDLVDEAARLTSEQVELDESAKDEISKRIDVLSHMENVSEAEITYFVQDVKKIGGTYETARGIIKKYDALSHVIRLDTGITINIDNIIDVKADCFEK